MYRLILPILLLVCSGTIAQELNISVSTLTKEKPITDGYEVKDMFAGQGDDIYIAWTLPPGASYILSRSSAKSGELKFAHQFENTIGSRSFYFVDGKLVALHMLQENGAMKCNYSIINDKGESDAEQLLISVPVAKSDELTIVCKSFRKVQDDGLMLVFYRYSSAFGKMVSKKVTVVDVGSDMKTTQRNYDIPIIEEFRLDDLKPDEAGNLNGLARRVKEKENEIVKKTETDFISFRKNEMDVLLVTLKMGGQELITAGHDSRDGRTVITGFAGQHEAAEPKSKSQPLLKFSSLVTFFTEVNIAEGTTVSEQVFKPGEVFLSEAKKRMDQASENEKRQSGLINIENVAITKSGEVNMILTLKVQYAKSGQEMYYPAEIFVLHYDRAGMQKWIKQPSKYKTTAKLLSIMQGEKDPLFIAYAVGFTSPGAKDEEVYNTAAAVKDDGITMPVITGDEERSIETDALTAMTRTVRMGSDKFVMMEYAFKKPYKLYIFEVK